MTIDKENSEYYKVGDNLCYERKFRLSMNIVEVLSLRDTRYIQGLAYVQGKNGVPTVNEDQYVLC